MFSFEVKSLIFNSKLFLLIVAIFLANVVINVNAKAVEKTCDEEGEWCKPGMNTCCNENCTWDEVRDYYCAFENGPPEDDSFGGFKLSQCRPEGDGCFKDSECCSEWCPDGGVCSKVETISHDMKANE